MAKYHINKHGVPAPCKATKGNCPLGGADSHFNSEEEAQAFIDSEMGNQYGLLREVPAATPVKYITINHNFDNIFLDDWDEQGMQITGIYRESLIENLDWNRGYKDLYNAIKNDAERIAKEKGDPSYVLIPEKNMKSHMRNNVLYPGEARGWCETPDEGWVTYNELKESAIKHFGRDALWKLTLWDEEEEDDEEEKEDDKDRYFFNEAFHEELVEFGAKRMKQDSQFNINGQSVYLEAGNGPYGINWVDEYAKAVKNGTERSNFKVISKD
jgi:hypothetical protein